MTNGCIRRAPARNSSRLTAACAVRPVSAVSSAAGLLDDQPTATGPPRSRPPWRFRAGSRSKRKLHHLRTLVARLVEKCGLAAALLATLAFLSPLVDAAVEELEVRTPRPYGYLIGDTIDHRISLVLSPGFELDPASLPEPGRTTRWLSLNEVVLDGKPDSDTSRHTIRLRYQVVNAGPNLVGAGTPPLRLRIVGPDDDLPVVIPAWGFTIGPIVTPEERPRGALPELRAALPPAPVPLTARTVRVAALGLLAAGLIVLVARGYLRGRFGPRARGYFEHAYRRVERRMAGAQAPGARADALIDIHAAFNATAGRAVFEHDLDRFFVEHPRFESLRARIETLFADSGKLFYGSAGDSPAGDPGLGRLRELCRACRDAERRR